MQWKLVTVFLLVLLVALSSVDATPVSCMAVQFLEFFCGLQQLLGNPLYARPYPIGGGLAAHQARMNARMLGRQARVNARLAAARARNGLLIG